MHKVSIVIPVLNAERYLPALFEAFAAQRPAPPHEVIVIDSNSRDRSATIATSAGARVVPIARFTHGAARNLGAREAAGDLVVYLSQDARPQDPQWLAELIRPFADPQVAAVYSRQVPQPDCKPMEAFFYGTHFPDGQPLRREKGNRSSLALRDVFFSNVSSAVRRDILIRHPFDENLIMSEDQQLARDILEAGYATVYQPASRVIHSHNYSLHDVFQRYFDSCYSLTKIFPAHDHAASARIGFSYLGREAWHMLRHHPLWLPYYVCHVAALTLGTLAGHHAEHLPRALVKRLSLHAYHWDTQNG